ncbi:hypothetical protein HD554DRAFT_394520 [Boletus coccyginus]|nr:hypothetical protein HD554DRAFT_394520 [Boletus coccyginus]
MPTLNSCFPGPRQAHYSELSAAPLDTSTALAHQTDNQIHNQHGVKPRPWQGLNSQDHMTSNAIDKRTPTAMMARADRAHRQDVGQPKRASPRQGRERRASFDQRGHQTQASISALPRTLAAWALPNGVNQPYIPTRTIVLSQDQPDLDVLPDEYHQLSPAESHRLQALFPPAVPLVPREKSSTATFLERLNPFCRIRSLSTPPTYTAIIFIPSENSGHARRRSLARRA